MPQLKSIEPEFDGAWRFQTPATIFDHLRIAMVREFPRPTQMFLYNHGDRFIQLGGGRKFIRGWDGWDYPEWDAEKDAIPEKDDSIAGIVSYHMFDHISPNAVRHVLLECARVLRDEGTLTVIVPHYMGELAHSCIDHKTQFGIDSWRNVLDNKHDPTQDDNGIELKLGFNMILGLSEANLVLVTQFVRTPRHG
jgi:Methyltransferase domain